uniref:Secreted protein n=1 Tax=Tetranychus urticae TaxID=32264 RepID=T1KEN8_TETUR
MLNRLTVTLFVCTFEVQVSQSFKNIQSPYFIFLINAQIPGLHLAISKPLIPTHLYFDLQFAFVQLRKKDYKKHIITLWNSILLYTITYGTDEWIWHFFFSR